MADDIPVIACGFLGVRLATNGKASRDVNFGFGLLQIGFGHIFLDSDRTLSKPTPQLPKCSPQYDVLFNSYINSQNVTTRWGVPIAERVLSNALFPSRCKG